jgi:hypothetical protein
MDSPVQVVDADGYARVIARQGARTGEEVFTCAPDEVVAVRTRRTVQIGPGRHLANRFVDFVNHSCAPTTVLDVGSLAFVALRDLRAGDEVTFFYPGSESELAHEFRCHCGSPMCVGWVAGGLALPAERMLWALGRGYCTSYLEGELRRAYAARHHARWPAIVFATGM